MRHGTLVPCQAVAGDVGQVELAGPDLEGAGQHRMSPVLPLQPLPGRSDPEQVPRHLGIQVRGHRQAGHVGDRGGPQPPGHPADPHQVRHHQVARPSPDRVVHGSRAVEVLPEHDRSGQVRGKPGVAVQVVIAQRLLDPAQALGVQRPAALQRLTQAETLVIVRDQRHLVPGRGPDPADRGDVVGRAVPADPDLQAREPALVQQFQRLLGHPLRRDEPEAVAVVGGDRGQRAAQQHGQRQAGRLGQHVPQGDVEPGHRGQRQTLVPGEAEPAAGVRVRGGGRGRLPAQRGAEIGEHRPQGRRGAAQVGRQVTAPGDALLRAHVDEQQRPAGEVSHLGGQRPAQRHHHRPYRHVPHDQPGMFLSHVSLPETRSSAPNRRPPSQLTSMLPGARGLAGAKTS
jgi:hypothetical protein